MLDQYSIIKVSRKFSIKTQCSLLSFWMKLSDTKRRVFELPQHRKLSPCMYSILIAFDINFDNDDEHNFLNINLYREHSNANKARGDEEDAI